MSSRHSKSTFERSDTTSGRRPSKLSSTITSQADKHIHDEVLPQAGVDYHVTSHCECIPGKSVDHIPELGGALSLTSRHNSTSRASSGYVDELENVLGIIANKTKPKSNKLVVQQEFYPEESVKNEWVEIAKNLPVTKEAFRVLRIARCCYLSIYLVLALFCLLSTLLKPFLTSSGACLEANYPVSYLLFILMLCYSSEQVQDLAQWEKYTEDLLRWQNTTRWRWRNLEGGIISVFIDSLACIPDLIQVILTLLFYLSGLTNFGEYNSQNWQYNATRSLRSYWYKRGDPRYKLVPFVHTSWVVATCRWVSVLSCVIAPSFFVIKNFIVDPLWWGSSIAPAIYGIYVAGIFQLIFIFGIPVYIRTYKQDDKLWKVFLISEGVLSGVLCICKIVMVFCYIIPTRYTG